jgi:hypothetical protein
LDAIKSEFKVLISCILVANTTPNQQTTVRLAMPLWMCIQHVKVRLLYTNRETLVVLKNYPTNYCLAHSIFLFYCKCVSSVYIEGFNTGLGEGDSLARPFARGWRCGTAGLGRGASSPMLLALQWRSSGGIDERVVAVVSKRSRHRGNDGEEVLARARRRRRRVSMAASCALVASLMAVRRWQCAL